MKKENLFPVNFEGKQYFEKDCDGVFLAVYPCREALNWEGGVYMTEGLWIYPDGSTIDESR